MLTYTIILYAYLYYTIYNIYSYYTQVTADESSLNHLLLRLPELIASTQSLNNNNNLELELNTPISYNNNNPYYDDTTPRILHNNNISPRSTPSNGVSPRNSRPTSGANYDINANLPGTDYNTIMYCIYRVDLCIYIYV